MDTRVQPPTEKPQLEYYLTECVRTLLPKLKFSHQNNRGFSFFPLCYFYLILYLIKGGFDCFWESAAVGFEQNRKMRG
ncbi:hypothetical protein CMV_007879 [Castanea mollissima]|uniref:Uncharacterized protein n=1 Tax=Castanea mollissima TaxID=60419 RepID=A0A8J4RHB0_9ROSI|nr:hypothetical protein CMV_007879 [Castanea mollissima]